MSQDPDRRRRHRDERVRTRCTRGVAERLRTFDHHVVWLDGRPAVLITYPLLELDLDLAPEPIWCEASLTYAAGHPTAPPEIQSLAQGLAWQLVTPGAADER